MMVPKSNHAVDLVFMMWITNNKTSRLMPIYDIEIKIILKIKK